MSLKEKMIRLNYCSRSELRNLSGIGRKRANSIVDHREKYGPFLTIEDLEVVPSLNKNLVQDIKDKLDWSFNGYFASPPQIIQTNAGEIAKKINQEIDVIITSPPYWRKRDYNHPEQIGQESAPADYIQKLCEIIDSWIPVLSQQGTVFINIGDTFLDGNILGIPAMLEVALRQRGWLIVNKIIWAKENGVPEPLRYRLASRHEVIYQISQTQDFYSDSLNLSKYLGENGNPGDVWTFPQGRSKTDHLAPFPDELVRRIIYFACPDHVCLECGKPFLPHMEPSFDLDMTRPQAVRAIELFEKAGLSEKHLNAIRAVGISDAGKAKKIQSTGNSEKTQRLANEAKKILGGYFREFTFSKKVQVGWDRCECELDTRPGTVLDPFMGSGTTVRIAYQMGYNAIGSDLIVTKQHHLP